jgi:hypothetical protein
MTTSDKKSADEGRRAARAAGKPTYLGHCRKCGPGSPMYTRGGGCVKCARARARAQAAAEPVAELHGTPAEAVEVHTREQAWALGVRYYWARGSTCKRGHEHAVRRTIDGRCVRCHWDDIAARRAEQASTRRARSLISLSISPHK